MAKTLCLMLAFVFVVSFMSLSPFVKADIILNEIMPHSNNAYGDEWVELSNDGEAISVNWTIKDKQSSDNFQLSIPKKGYALIGSGKIECSSFSGVSCIKVTTIGNGLNDANDSVYIYSEENIIDDFSWLKSIKSSGDSWSYDGSWEECSPTPGRENKCDEDEDQSTNLEISHDEEIINGEEFRVLVSIENFENKDYDIRIWLTPKNDDKAISEIYDEDGEKWRSGIYYLEKAIDGPDDEKEFRLRIRESYSDFEDDAEINVYIRAYGTSNVIKSEEEDIEIVIHEYGALLVKKCKDTKRIEMLARRIYA